MVPVNLCPSSTARIVADGNCFFRSLSFVLTGSQDYHQEVRLLVTTYMIDNTGNLQLSSLIKDGERMENYIEQSKMQLLGTWATEIEIIASALLLQTTFYVYGPCGKSNKWQKHAFESEEANIHYNECIYYVTILKLLKRCNSVLMRIKCAFVVCINSFNTEPITDHVHRTFGDLCK